MLIRWVLTTNKMRMLVLLDQMQTQRMMVLPIILKRLEFLPKEAQTCFRVVEVCTSLNTLKR